MHNLFCSSCSFWKLEFFHYLKMNDTVMVKFENQNLLVFQTWNTSVKMLIFCSIFNHLVLFYFELHKTHKIPNNCAVFFVSIEFQKGMTAQQGWLRKFWFFYICSRHFLFCVTQISRNTNTKLCEIFAISRKTKSKWKRNFLDFKNLKYFQMII